MAKKKKKVSQYDSYFSGLDSRLKPSKEEKKLPEVAVRFDNGKYSGSSTRKGGLSKADQKTMDEWYKYNPREGSTQQNKPQVSVLPVTGEDEQKPSVLDKIKGFFTKKKTETPQTEQPKTDGYVDFVINAEQRKQEIKSQLTDLYKKRDEMVAARTKDNKSIVASTISKQLAFSKDTSRAYGADEESKLNYTIRELEDSLGAYEKYANKSYSEDQKGFLKSFWRGLKETATTRLEEQTPFFGGAYAANRKEDLRKAQEKWTKKEDLSSYEKALVENYMSDQYENIKKNPKFWDTIAEGAGQMIIPSTKFMAEYAALGPVATAMKLPQLGKNANMVYKVANSLIGAALESVIRTGANAPALKNTTMDYMIPNQQVAQDPETDSVIIKLTPGMSEDKARGKAFLNNLIENASEKLSDVIAEPKAAIKKVVAENINDVAKRLGIVVENPGLAWMKASLAKVVGGKTFKKVADVVDMGSLTDEILEEEVGELAQAPLEDRQYKLPFLTQEGTLRLATESLGIGAHMGALQGISSSVDAIENWRSKNQVKAIDLSNNKQEPPTVPESEVEVPTTPETPPTTEGMAETAPKTNEVAQEEKTAVQQFKNTEEMKTAMKKEWQTVVAPQVTASLGKIDTQEKKVQAQKLLANALPNFQSKWAEIAKGQNFSVTAPKQKKKNLETLEKPVTVYHGTSLENATRLKRGITILTAEEKMKLQSTGGGNFGLSTSLNKKIADNYATALSGTSVEITLNRGAKVKYINSNGEGIDGIYTHDQLESLANTGVDAVIDISENVEDEVRILRSENLIQPKQKTETKKVLPSTKKNQLSEEDKRLDELVTRSNTLERLAYVQSKEQSFRDILDEIKNNSIDGEYPNETRILHSLLLNKKAPANVLKEVLERQKKLRRLTNEELDRYYPEAREKVKGTQAEQVKEAVKEGPKTIKEIAEETKILEPNIRRILGVGTKEGTFERVASGVYILTKNGKSMAYVIPGDALKELPRLVKEGFKADMVFLDIPYKTNAVVGGNRGVKYDLISVEEFDEFIQMVGKITRSDDTPVFYMYSQAESGTKQMERYNNILLYAGYKAIARGNYNKTYKDGSPVKNQTGKVQKPEGIILFSKSGKVPVGELPINLDFTMVRPTGWTSEKPAAMLNKLIRMTTKEGDLVFDPFAGSGSTLVAAVETGRTAVGIEKSEKAIEEHIKPNLEKAKSAVDTLAEKYAQMLGQSVTPFHTEIAKAIVNKENNEKLINLIASSSDMNKVTKKLFQEYTGIKLPATITAKKQALAKWGNFEIKEEVKAPKEEKIPMSKDEVLKTANNARLVQLGERMIRSNGKVMKYIDFLKSKLDEGLKLRIEVQNYDYEKYDNLLRKANNARSLDQSNNYTRQAEAVKTAGKMNRYRLDDDYGTGFDLTKMEYELAQTLVKEEAKPVKQKAEVKEKKPQEYHLVYEQNEVQKSLEKVARESKNPKEFIDKLNTGDREISGAEISQILWGENILERVPKIDINKEFEFVKAQGKPEGFTIDGINLFVNKGDRNLWYVTNTETGMLMASEGSKTKAGAIKLVTEVIKQRGGAAKVKEIIQERVSKYGKTPSGGFYISQRTQRKVDEQREKSREILEKYAKRAALGFPLIPDALTGGFNVMRYDRALREHILYSDFGREFVKLFWEKANNKTEVPKVEKDTAYEKWLADKKATGRHMWVPKEEYAIENAMKDIADDVQIELLEKPEGVKFEDGRFDVSVTGKAGSFDFTTEGLPDLETVRDGYINELEAKLKELENEKVPLQVELEQIADIKSLLEIENQRKLGVGKDQQFLSHDGQKLRTIPSTIAKNIGTQESVIRALNKKLLGNEDISFVDGVSFLGKYHNGLITLAKNKTDVADTHIHEVVHAALDMFIQPKERKQILDEVIAKYGEEKLHEKWQVPHTGSEKYRLPDTVNTNSLLTFHNTDVENLDGIFKEGLMVPSTAITDYRFAPTGFGEISFIGGSSLVENVYNADAYTRRLRKQYHINRKFQDTLLSGFSISKELLDRSEYSRESYAFDDEGYIGSNNYINSKLKDNLISLIEFLSSKGKTKEQLQPVTTEEYYNRYGIADTKIIENYIEENGISIFDIEPEETDISKGKGKIIANLVNKAIEEENKSDRARGVSEEYANMLTGAYREKFFGTNGNLNFGTVDSFHNSLSIKQKHARTIVRNATQQLYQNMIHSEGWDHEYNDWNRKIQDGLRGKAFFYSPRGTGKQIPWTEKNVLKAMKGQQRGQETGIGGVGQLRGRLSRRFRSLEDLKNSQFLLTTAEGMESEKERFDIVFNGLIDELGVRDSIFYEELGIAVRTKLTLANVKYGINNAISWEIQNRKGDGITELPPEPSEAYIKDVYAALRQLKEGRTEYFEGKIQRIVSPLEFEGLLVPNTEEAMREIKRLEQQGLIPSHYKIVFYDVNDDTSRARELEANFKQSMYRGKRVMTNNIYDLAEEQLAEDGIQAFNDITTQKGLLRQFFEKFVNFLKDLIGASKKVDRFYRRLFNGKLYKQGGVVNSNFARYRLGQDDVLSMLDELTKEISQDIESGKIFETLGTPILPSTKAQVAVEKSVQEQSTPASREASFFMPVLDTKGEKKKSRAMDRLVKQFLQFKDNGLIPESTEYTPMSLRNMLAKAQKFAQEYPSAAEDVAMGRELPPEGVTAIGVGLTLGAKLWKDGEHQKAVTIWQAMSFRQTRYGQETVSTRGALDEDSPLYFMKEIMDAKEQIVLRDFQRKQKAMGVTKVVKNFSEVKKEKVNEIKKSLKETKIRYAQEFLDTLICK